MEGARGGGGRERLARPCMTTPSTSGSSRCRAEAVEDEGEGGASSLALITALF